MVSADVFDRAALLDFLEQGNDLMFAELTFSHLRPPWQSYFAWEPLLLHGPILEGGYNTMSPG